MEIAARARIDRLKADFIASLPRQPCGSVCYLFCTPSKANIGNFRWIRPQNGITSAEREKRRAAQPGRAEKLRRISFGCGGPGCFLLRRAAVQCAQRQLPSPSNCARTVHSARRKTPRRSATDDGNPKRRAPKTKSPLTQRAFVTFCHFEKSGAGEGIRTLDPDLGKVVLYH